MTENPDAYVEPLVTRLDVPADVAAALDDDPTARGEFATLPPAQKRGWVEHVEAAEDGADRDARIRTLVEKIPCLPPGDAA